jgi:hypothetical protein
MRLRHSLELFISIAVAAMPLAAQRIPVTYTLTVQVPAFYRIILDLERLDQAGNPMVSVSTNIRGVHLVATQGRIPDPPLTGGPFPPRAGHRKGDGSDEGRETTGQVVRYTVAPP